MVSDVEDICIQISVDLNILCMKRLALEITDVDMAEFKRHTDPGYGTKHKANNSFAITWIDEVLSQLGSFEKMELSGLPCTHAVASPYGIRPNNGINTELQESYVRPGFNRKDVTLLANRFKQVGHNSRGCKSKKGWLHNQLCLLVMNAAHWFHNNKWLGEATMSDSFGTLDENVGMSEEDDESHLASGEVCENAKPLDLCAVQRVKALR
ncbi:hypothetical protein Tco_1556358 [Tanacetum coccineum]